MGRPARLLLLRIIATDRTFEQVSHRGTPCWEGKCIHCNRRLRLTLAGEPISRATVEHIRPRSHGGDDALTNLAVACSRCNHGKGARLDRRRRGDPRLEEVIAATLERRRSRWRDPD